jgi:MFS family permease
MSEPNASVQIPASAIGLETASEIPLTGSQLLALGCSIGLVPLNSTMIAVAIPSIALDMAIAPDTLILWLVTSYLLVNIVALNPAGKMGDRWGYVRMLRLGQSLFFVGSIVGFFGHSLPLLCSARLLMAIGGALVVPAAMALVRVRLPDSQRAHAFGMFGAALGFSAAIGPPVGGEIAARFGWPALFLVNILPLTIAGALSIRNGSKPEVRQPTSRFDLLGSALLGAGLSLIVIGVRTPSLWLPLVVSGLGLLLVFASWEGNAADPIVDLGLFRRRGFAAGSFIIGLQNFAIYALLFELPLVFSRSFGATSAELGHALFALTLAMVIGSIIGGRLAGNRGPRKIAVIGGSVALAGGVVMALIPLASVKGALLELLALGLGVGLCSPAATAALMSVVSADESGMASAVASTVRYLGGIAGVGFVSTMVKDDSPLVAHQHDSVILACALALALALASVIPRKGDRIETL